MRWTKSALPLKTEWEFFLRNRERLISKADGKFVLIKGRRLHGFHHCEWDAIDKGRRRFGNVPILVKRITRFDQPISIVTPFILSV